MNPYREEVAPLYVGIIVPDAQTAFASEMKRVVEIFQRNENLNLNGRQVEIIIYPDGHDTPDEAVTVANRIVAEKHVLAVIGHFYSNSAIKVGPLYADAGIPIITSSAGSPAVTKDNPWYFRALSNNSIMASYAALYASKVLNHQQASVIYEDNPFGESLDAAFKDIFTKNGGTIAYEEKMSHRDNLDDTGKREAQAIIAKMTGPNGLPPGMVFLALNDNEAIQFMLAMDSAKQRYPLLAAYDQGDANFARLFEPYPQEAGRRGYFTNGMIAFSPLIYDVSNQKAHDFYNRYVNQYHEEPTWLGATTYDALLLAVDALDKTKATGEAPVLKDERKKIRDYLESINTTDRAVDGLTGQIYFDREHNFSQPPTFGIFQNGNFMSAPIQLRPIHDTRLIADLNTALRNGDIIQDQNTYFSKANVVYTGIHLNEIADVDVDKAHTFTADFYLWFRYEGDLPVDAIEFVNSVNPIKLGAPISTNTLDQINYRLYRIRDKFYTTSELQDYPFDHQELAIRFRHSTLTREKLIYVDDIVGMKNITGGSELLRRISADHVFATVPDWKPEAPGIFITVHTNKDSFGNPATLGIEQNIENSTFNMKIGIERNYKRFVVKNLLPLLCLIILAYLSLYLPPVKFENIISIITGSTLSIVIFHVNMTNRLSVGYNVALDYLFFATYILLILELVIGLFAWHSDQQGNKTRSRWLMVFARIAYPAYVIGVTMLVFWLYTNPNGLGYLTWLKAHLIGL